MGGLFRASWVWIQLLVGWPGLLRGLCELAFFAFSSNLSLSEENGRHSLGARTLFPCKIANFLPFFNTNTCLLTVGKLPRHENRQPLFSFSWSPFQLSPFMTSQKAPPLVSHMVYSQPTRSDGPLSLTCCNLTQDSSLWRLGSRREEWPWVAARPPSSAWWASRAARGETAAG